MIQDFLAYMVFFLFFCSDFYFKNNLQIGTMFKIYLTDQVKSIISQLMEHDVFSYVIADYSIDQHYLYIPKDSIKDKNILAKLIREKKLILADN
jgi:hypothetical protein